MTRHARCHGRAVWLGLLLAAAAVARADRGQADDLQAQVAQAQKLKLWQRGLDCPSCSANALEVMSARFARAPVLALRGGCDETDCAVVGEGPNLAALTAELGSEFAAALQQNIREHEADCAKSCETFYCGQGPQDAEADVDLPDVTSYSMGDVPPEDFSGDFRFPLDLIKVTQSPLFSPEECAEVVATAEAEDVHLNEYVSGKYKLGGDWMYNLPQTLTWFNRQLEHRIFPILAKLFPEIISGPEVLRAHSVAMLKYNSSHPRTDVHVDNGILALTVALTPNNQYQGGGTFFEHMGVEPLPMDAGHATFRPGSIRHGGHTVISGERYIIGAFILIADKVEHVRRFNGMGYKARGKGDNQGALKFFEWGLKMNPRCVTCMKNLGEALMAEGRHEEAERRFRQAVELTPRDSDGLFNLGGVLKAQGRLDECIDAYRRSLAINPDDWELCYNLGVALGDKGRFKEEAVMYHKGLQINPGHAQSHANLGVAVASGGDLEGSIPHFKQACKLAPTNGQNWFNLAKTLLMLGRKDEAGAAQARAAALGIGGMAPAPPPEDDVEDF